MNTNEPELISMIQRQDGGSLRLHKHWYAGRSYYQLASWSSDEQRCFYLNIRRGEVRGLISLLEAACRDMGLSPSMAEEAKSQEG